MSTSITVAICTRNRCLDLQATLASLRTLTVPRGWNVELLLVDNASTDGTAEIARAFVWPGTSVRCLQEPVIGQARARNLALQHAAGDVIVFTDDDLRFAPDWLTEICAPLLDGRADAVVGRIDLARHLQPAWMEPELKAYFCSTAQFVDPPEHLVGASFGFRRAVLADVPRFDVELGPGALGFCDDSLFGWQLARKGYRLMYARNARAEHHFAVARLRRDALLELASKHGRSTAYVDYQWRHSEPDAARWRAWGTWVALQLWRIRHLDRVWSAGCIEMAEFRRVRWVNYFLHLACLARRERCYEPYGAVKKCGKESHVDRGGP